MKSLNLILFTLMFSIQAYSTTNINSNCLDNPSSINNLNPISIGFIDEAISPNEISLDFQQSDCNSLQQYFMYNSITSDELKIGTTGLSYFLDAENPIVDSEINGENTQTWLAHWTLWKFNSDFQPSLNINTENSEINLNNSINSVDVELFVGNETENCTYIRRSPESSSSSKGTQWISSFTSECPVSIKIRNSDGNFDLYNTQIQWDFTIMETSITKIISSFPITDSIGNPIARTDGTTIYLTVRWEDNFYKFYITDEDGTNI